MYSLTDSSLKEEKNLKNNNFLTVNHQFKSGIIGEDVFIVIDKRGIRIVRSNMTGQSTANG